MADSNDPIQPVPGQETAKTPSVSPDDSASPLEDIAETSAEDQRVSELLARSIDVPVLASAVEQQEAADAADTLEDLEEEEAFEVLEQMEDQAAADALAEMQTPLAVSVIGDMVDDEPRFVGRLLQLMASDDAADLLQALESDDSEAVLSTLPPGDASALRELMGYDEESAGGLMTTDFAHLRTDLNVSHAIEIVREESFPEDMQQLPVVDEAGTLVGQLSLRALLIGRPDDRVADLMNQSVRVVRLNMDREEVAREFDRYDCTALPVVDPADRLVGLVTVDDVIDIIRAEQTEDVQLTVGAGAGEAVYSGLGEKLRGRLPWLTASLIMTGVAASVVLIFETLIQEHTFLAFLMPLIAALVGNGGHQALAVTLRGIVLDEVRRDRVGQLLFRETLVGLLNGLALGGLILVIVAGLSAAGFHSATWQLGAIAAIATTVAMAVGTLAGSSVPLIMWRSGVDPAHASAIFLIMITDAVAFVTLLGLTFALRGFLVTS